MRPAGAPHVLMLCRSFPHHRAGGMEWHAQDVAEGLMEAGARVSVVTTPLPRRAVLRPLEVNGEIITLGRRAGAYDAGFVLGLWRRLPGIVRMLRPTVLHAQGFAGLAAWQVRRRVPVLTTIHGTLWSETPWRAGERVSPADAVRMAWRFRHRLAFAPLWHWFLRQSPPIITDSQFTVEELRRETGVAPNIARVVPLGFDLTRFPMVDRAVARRHWGIVDGARVALFVGRMEQTKRPDLLLAAAMRVAAKVPGLQVIFAGEGAAADALKARAATSPIAGAVRFTGRVEAADLPGLLAAADVFVNPDQGAPAFGLANAEALVMGTPVIASRRGAHGEVVAHAEDGELIDGTDPRAWAGVLARWLARPQGDAAQRSARARQRFGREVMIQSLLEAYDSVSRHHRR